MKYALFSAVILLAACSSERPPANKLSYGFADGAGGSDRAAWLRANASSMVALNPKPLSPPVMPIYPASLLEKHLGIIKFEVGLAFSKDGRVSVTSFNPIESTLGELWNNLFRMSVETAVESWRFEPPKMEYYGLGLNGQSTLLGVEPSQIEMILPFTFEQNGRVEVPAFY